MAIIHKKILPQYFEAIACGKKNYEIRRGDCPAKEGDILLLEEWNPETNNYTGRKLQRTVLYEKTFFVDKLFWSREDIENHGLKIMSLSQE